MRKQEIQLRDAHEEQKKMLDALVGTLEGNGSAGGRKVGTYMAPLGPFYRAEEYHQQFYAKQKGGSAW